MKKKYIFITLLLMIVIIGIVFYFIIEKDDKNISKNIEGRYSNIIITDFETAKTSLEDVKEELNITSIKEQLKEERIDTTGNIVNTYKLKQMYNNVEVYQSNLIIYTDKDGNANGIINNLKNIKYISTDPQKTIEDIDNVIEENYGISNNITERNLIIYPEDNKYTLAYEYKIKLIKDSTATVIVDATTGNIITEDIPIYYLENTDIEYFLNDNKYVLHDRERNISVGKASEEYLNYNTTQYETYSWDNNEMSEENKYTTEAIVTIQKCYDYFKNKFQYFSFTGDVNNQAEVLIVPNVKGYEFVNVKDENFSNNAALVPPSLILIGYNNLYNSNIEVLGHEYTHGIFYYRTGESCNTLESRALNEAYADIMGMCIEAYYNGNTSIDGYINSNVGRNIKDSKLKYSYDELHRNQTTEWLKDEFLGREEHYYSTIISRSAYLMSQKIELEKFEKLWFNSMKLLRQNPDFVDCYYAVMQTAKMMNLSEEEKKVITDAFDEVGLTEYYNSSQKFNEIIKFPSIVDRIDEEIKNQEEKSQENKSEVVSKVGDLALEIEQGNPFKEGVACVRKNGKYGYIDKTGEITIGIQYDDANNFYNGIASVKKDGKWGYIDKTGKLIIDYKYDEVGDFSEEGLAPVKNESSKWGYIDKSGKTIIDFQYMEADKFYDGIAQIKKDYQEYIYIDINGKAINDSTYKEGLICSDGLIGVSNDEKHWGYIDKNGNTVIEFKYLEVSNFNDGLAFVNDNGTPLIIDKIGNIKLNGTDDYYIKSNFTEGLAGIQSKISNGKFGFINESGRVVVECEYDYYDEFSEGLSAVRVDSNGKYGFIDGKGNNVIEYKYDSVSHFSEGLVSVKINGKVGYINKEGKVIIGNLSATNNLDENNKKEDSAYNLNGTFMGKHTQDSMFSQIEITGNNITWGAPGEELNGTFSIEENELKATWNDGTNTTLTIVNNNQIKGKEPFSDTGEIVIFNKQ